MDSTLRFRGKKRDASPESEQNPRGYSSSVDYTRISSGHSHVDVQALSSSQAWFLERAREIGKTLVFTDIGRDCDDMAALVLGSYLTKDHVLKIEGVVSTLTPAAKRAQLARYTLDTVGLVSVPVGVGSDLPSVAEEDIHLYEFRDLPDQPMQSKRASTVLERTLRQAEDGSLNFLIIAAFTDLSNYLKSSGDARKLFKQKVKRVVIMGGVKITKEGEAALNEKGFMVPDTSANYQYDPDAASYAFDFFQTSKVPMTLVSRHAVYEAQLPRETLDALARTGHPIGRWLRDMSQEAFTSLWERANLPVDNTKRSLPARCDRKWFLTTFCEGEPIQEGESVWRYIKKISVYDPIAMLACAPTYRERFFHPTTVVINDTYHLIIGLSAQQTGIKNAKDLQKFMTNSLIAALKEKHE
jgi:inosine-uridine nucleoside N-ribohydrolase